MLITKEVVLKAIRTEPLAAGRWVQNPRYLRMPASELNTVPPKTKSGKCRVCAVGAVLRRAGFSDKKIYDKGDHIAVASDGFHCSISSLFFGDGERHQEDIKEAFAHKNYLAALSCKFEHLATHVRRIDGTIPKLDLIQIRKDLVRFVEKNFPESFEVEL